MSIVSSYRDDLAKVAQYLRVEQKVEGAVVNRMAEYLQEEIRERISHAMPDDPFYGLNPDTSPADAIMHDGLCSVGSFRQPKNAIGNMKGMIKQLYGDGVVAKAGDWLRKLRS